MKPADERNAVIIEWGTWGRSERDRLRTEARMLGAQVELIVLDPPVDELWRRIERRVRENPSISRDDLERWNGIFERPAADELADYDVSLVLTT